MKEVSSKERFCYIFSICALLLLILIICILAFTGVFYGVQVDKITSVPLGTDITISIGANDCNAFSFAVSGGVIPNEKIAQNINIKNTSTEKIFVRVKSVIVALEDNCKIDMSNLNNWVKNGEYAYFLKEINQGESVGCAKNLVINEEYELSSKYNYNIVVIVESLGENFDVKNIWNLPLNFYENDV